MEEQKKESLVKKIIIIVSLVVVVTFATLIWFSVSQAKNIVVKNNIEDIKESPLMIDCEFTDISIFNQFIDLKEKVDEAQNIKNPSTGITKAVKEVNKNLEKNRKIELNNSAIILIAVCHLKLTIFFI